MTQGQSPAPGTRLPGSATPTSGDLGDLLPSCDSVPPAILTNADDCHQESSNTSVGTMTWIYMESAQNNAWHPEGSGASELFFAQDAPPLPLPTFATPAPLFGHDSLLGSQRGARWTVGSR